MESFALIFIIGILFRTISGVQNGAFYGRRYTLGWAASVILFCWAALSAYSFFPEGWTLKSTAVFVLFVLSVFSLPVVHWGLLKNYKLVHFGETALTGFYTLALIVLNPGAALLSVYPGTYLFKGFVNVLAGNKWHYNGTDDPSGNFYTLIVPIVKWEIKVPRTTQKLRLGLSILSLIAFIIIQFR
jgi:hypothetical protein